LLHGIGEHLNTRFVLDGGIGVRRVGWWFGRVFAAHTAHVINKRYHDLI